MSTEPKIYALELTTPEVVCLSSILESSLGVQAELIDVLSKESPKEMESIKALCELRKKLTLQLIEKTSTVLDAINKGG